MVEPGSGLTISKWISSHAQYRPNKVGFVFCNDVGARQSFTWRQLHERVNQIGYALRALGVSKGDRVASILPNSVELVEL